MIKEENIKNRINFLEDLYYKHLNYMLNKKVNKMPLGGIIRWLYEIKEMHVKMSIQKVLLTYFQENGQKKTEQFVNAKMKLIISALEQNKLLLRECNKSMEAKRSHLRRKHDKLHTNLRALKEIIS